MQREPHPPTLGHEPLEEHDAATSPVTRFGTVVGGGVLAALAATIPAELRIGDGGSVARAFEQWLALAAVLTPLAIFAVAVLRRGRVGLRLLAGERAPLYAAAAVWWSVLELAFLSVVGAVLRAKTHHHGLAGVTFALVALVSGTLIALLALRGAQMLSKMPPASQRIAQGVVSFTAFLSIVLIGIRTSRADGLHTAAALVDGVALVAAAAIASTPLISRWRPLSVGGVPAAAVILVLGYAAVHGEPELRTLLADGAPLQAFLLGLFQQ